MNEITFTKISLPNGWLSNMAPYPVTYKDVTYKTVEHLYQCLKFKDFPEIQEIIRNEKSPMSAKMRAKQYKDLILHTDFTELENIRNMKLCLNLKLNQHPKLVSKLLETGNALIVENCSKRHSASALYWGATKGPDNKWVGTNMLGTIWMAIRYELQQVLI